MIGPVFTSEAIRAGRRGRGFGLRWLYGGWLILLLFFSHQSYYQIYLLKNFGGQFPGNSTSNFANDLADRILWQQFALVVLAVPGLAAGAITDEKTRGTLEPLLIAHTHPAAIIGGKLLANTAQVLLLSLAAWPVLAFLGPFAGVSPAFFVVLAAVTTLVTLGITAISLLASVWARSSRDAVVAVYVLGAIAYVALEFLMPLVPKKWAAYLFWLPSMNPLEVLAPAREPANWPVTFTRLWNAAGVWISLTLICSVVAAWRLRPAFVKQQQTKRRFIFLRWFDLRPCVYEPPLSWKETFVGHRIPMWLGLAVVFFGVGWLSIVIFADKSPPPGSLAPPSAPAEELFNFTCIVVVLSSLAVAVRASGTISGERERKTWDGILGTPLGSSELVHDKHRGILTATWPYMFAAYLPAVAVVSLAENPENIIPIAWLLGLFGLIAALLVQAGAPVWPTVGAAPTLAFAFAGGPLVALMVPFSIAICWVTMYLVGAVGLWCSARFSSSWRSLVATVGLGYLCASLLGCVSVPFVCVSLVVFFFIGIFMPTALAPLTYMVSASACSFAYVYGARRFLQSAARRIAKYDRIPPSYVRMIEMDLPRYPRGEYIPPGRVIAAQASNPDAPPGF